MVACASSVPSFGGNSPTAKAEPRVALFTCLGRQMGALPLAPDEAFSALQAKRLKSLDDGALAAPSQVRVVITYWCTFLVPELADGATRPASAARTRVARAFCVHETLKYTRLQLAIGVDSSSSTQSSSGEPATRAPAQDARAFLEPFHTVRLPRDHGHSSLTHG